MNESKHTTGPFRRGPGLNEQTTEANASLMAVAPDLLSALERVLEHGERLNLYHERGEDAEMVNQARAAIAKAKGQSG